MRASTDDLIVEVLAARSGTTMLAREIGHHLSTVYDRGISPKAISKRLRTLEDEYPLLNRKATTNKEKALYNVRWIYLWGYWSKEDD
ncbi:unnamed protein product [marine sediment metagenome]|uniref:Uncharacterized protein n=1 Tax=marine sediment metagenome TaxID=412755 RepID=X0ZLJ7_9ZZZZ